MSSQHSPTTDPATQRPSSAEEVAPSTPASPRQEPPGTGATAGPAAQAQRPPQESSAEKTRKRLASYTFRNMVYSVLLILALALVWWALGDNTEQAPRNPVDIETTAIYAADQADWPVWVPELGDDWTTTTLWFDGRVEGIPTWHLSLVSPAGEYVAVHQAAEVTPEWMQRVLAEASVVGEVQFDTGPVPGASWEHWSGRVTSNAEVGYVLGPEHTGGATVVLHGTAEQAEFEAFLDLIEPR